MTLKMQQQRDSQGEVMNQELQSHILVLNQSLQQLSERLNQLEQRILSLENPQLMYKRPTSEEYESIASTLDYLHNALDELR